MHTLETQLQKKRGKAEKKLRKKERGRLSKKENGKS